MPDSRRSQGSATQQRWMVAARVMLAVFGGYLLAATSAMALASVLHHLGMLRADAALSAMLVQLLVHTGMAMVAFHVRSPLRASGWVTLMSIMCIGLAYAFAPIEMTLSPSMFVLRR